VRVPFTLPAGAQNEAQFQFYVNSISMPQRLKGTLTYVAKVTSHTATIEFVLQCRHVYFCAVKFFAPLSRFKSLVSDR